MKTQIYLIRHGQSLANAGGKIMPNADIPLTKLGHQQAQAAAHWLMPRLDGQTPTVYASTFLRTQQTAQPLCDLCQTSVQILEHIEEFNYLSFPKIAAFNRSQCRAYAIDVLQRAHWHERDGDDAESIAEFVQRVQTVWQRMQSWQRGVYVVYTHGFWLGMLNWLIQGRAMQTKSDFLSFLAFAPQQHPNNAEIRIIHQHQLTTVFCPEQ